KALRRELIDPKIAEHRGRIVKTTGDGMLVEFASVVDAGRCAVEVQETMATREAEIAAGEGIQFRGGVNLGERIRAKDANYSDGVNVAARLEAMAEPGTVCVSAAAWEQARGKVAVGVTDLGEHQLKNIQRPMRVFGIAPGSRSTTDPTKGLRLSLPDKPSIAVL